MPTLGFMLDAVPLHRGLDGLRILLVLELRRVHADDRQNITEPSFDRPELGQHVMAVDAAQRPEVQQHDATAKVIEAESPTARSDPEIGRAHV